MGNEQKTKTRNRKRTLLAGIGATLASAALIAGSMFVVATTANASEQAAADRASAQELYDAAEAQHDLALQAADDAALSAQQAEEAVTIAEAKQASQIATERAVQSKYASQGLTSDGKCPYGTTANQVNEDGTEGNCSQNGPNNKPCVAYNDDNVCTAWLKD
jgi:hypothetical protein